MPVRLGKETSSAIERARSAWPSLPLDETDFLAWLATRAGTAADPHVEDLWLVRACELNVHGALTAFERSALKPALQALPEPIRADVGQRVLQRLFTGREPKIRQYRGQGRLTRWLKVVALREARVERKISKRERPGDPLAEVAGAVAQTTLSGVSRSLHQPAREALAFALGTLTPDERKLMARHFLDGVTHQQLSDELGVPRSTIAYRLTRLTQRVLETTRDQLRESGLSRSELDSMVGAMRSQVDLSLSILKRA